MVPVQLSVLELYEAVWRTPLKKLADGWRLHPHALGQLLDRHHIPRPPNGYWTQKAVGKAVTIIPLPANLPPSRLIDISSLQGKKREKSKTLAIPLPPPKKSLGRYPLLKRIKGSLEKPTYQYEYIMMQPFDDSSVLRLDVSPQQSQRAISILHYIMSAFDENEWPVKVERRQYERRLINVVTVDGCGIRFRLRERLKQKKRELTAEEKSEKARNKWVWKQNINVPSGVLQLYIDGPLPAGMKSLFEDKDKLSLENQLGTFIEHLRASAAHSKVLAEQRKLREQKWEEERVLREHHENLVRDERRHIQVFMEMFANWQRANECRSFISEVIASQQAKTFSKEELERWKNWSEKIADAMDPLITGDLHSQIKRKAAFDLSIFEEAMSRKN